MKIIEVTNTDKNFFFDEKFEKFVREMARNTNPEIVKFLFENSLYRALTPNRSEWTTNYGISSIEKNRKPLSSSPFVQKLIDDYLKNSGFRALRSNSIFVTGERTTALNYRKNDRILAVVFPSKKFFFTWNPVSHDFFTSLYSHRIFLLNFAEIRKLKKEIVHALTDSIMFHLPSEIFHEEKENIELLMKKGHTKEALNLLETIVKRHFQEDRFQTDYMTIINEIADNHRKFDFDSEEELKKIIVLNRKNSLLRNFTNENFEEAVKSGNEIMITNDVFFYIEEIWFRKNRNRLWKILKKEYFSMKN
jgi:hypothetical protein